MAISDASRARLSTLAVGTAAATVPSGSFTVIGGLKSGSWSVTTSEIDTTNNDDVGFTSHLLGNTSLELTAEYVYDPTDAAQALIRAAAVEFGGGSFKAIKAWRVRPFGAGAYEEFAFDGNITSHEMNPGENESEVVVSITVKAVGASIATAAAHDANQS